MNQNRPTTLVRHREMPFQVVPVIDLLNGRAVHAVAGRRDHYQPIRSLLHTSCEPIPLACAIRDQLQLPTLYLADLDAIGGRPASIDVCRAITEYGIHLWVDAGIRNVRSIEPLLELVPATVDLVVGLETVAGPGAVAEIVSNAGAGRVIFSLDLFEGRPRIAAPAEWSTENPRDLAAAAIDRGIRRLLILDLARVGTGQGLSTGDLLTAVHANHPEVDLAVGGGVSRIEDVLDLRAAGAHAVLVGSAIHDGRIGTRDLKRIDELYAGASVNPRDPRPG